MSQSPLITPSPVCATSPLDPQEFRAALGMFATGVTIVTARAEDGTLVGLTASHYAINILAADQKELAQRFATRDIDRFAGVRFREGCGGAPVLEGCTAVFECANRSQYEEGDHVIFVGEVEACTRSDQAQPLIFHGGRYYTELPI